MKVLTNIDPIGDSMKRIFLIPKEGHSQNWMILLDFLFHCFSMWHDYSRFSLAIHSSFIWAYLHGVEYFLFSLKSIDSQCLRFISISLRSCKLLLSTNFINPQLKIPFSNLTNPQLIIPLSNQTHRLGQSNFSVARIVRILIDQKNLEYMFKKDHIGVIKKHTQSIQEEKNRKK